MSIPVKQIEEQKAALLKKHNILYEGENVGFTSYVFDVSYGGSEVVVSLMREDRTGNKTLVESVKLTQLNG